MESFSLLVILVVGVCRGDVMQYTYTTVKSCKHPPTTTPYKSLSALSMLDCVRRCSHDVGCSSAEFDEPSQMCYMFNDAVCDNIPTPSRLFIKKPICLNNGTLDETTQTCKCYNGYIGDACERIMRDCTEGYKSGHYVDDEFASYLIKPDLAPTAFTVMCTMKNYGGGTIIMKNTQWTTNPNLNMNRNWADYKNGFGGSVMENHWIGLQNMYYITSSRPQHIYFGVTAETGNWKEVWRKYDNFKVEDETTNYRMTYSGSFPWTQTEAAADPDWKVTIEPIALGDSMVGLNGSAFSTYDQDNDLDAGRNCALDYEGGWWHNACADCNPTGPHKSTRNVNAVNEVFWKYNYFNYKIGFVNMGLKAA